MRTVVCESPELAGAAAAARVEALLSGTSHRVLGLATGSSPQPLYRSLAAHVAGGLSLTDLTAFAIDEYVGIPRDRSQSYHAIIERDAVGPLGLDPTRVHVPDGQARDVDVAADAFERAIAAAGGVEVQILGIGGNGHIGFNEPGSPEGSRTRVVRLAESTRRANSRFFPSVDDVPTHAITQGIATLTSARHIVLLASGNAKARAVRDALNGPIDPSCPASLLRRHPDVVVFLDREAARLLPPGAAR